MKSLENIQEGEASYNPKEQLESDIDVQLLLESLPEHERSILSMLMEGLSNAEISQELGLSRKTIDRKIAWLKVKLGG